MPSGTVKPVESVAVAGTIGSVVTEDPAGTESGLLALCEQRRSGGSCETMTNHELHQGTSIESLRSAFARPLNASTYCSSVVSRW